MSSGTKTKGDITELQCILAFKKIGCIISIPYGEDSPYDFIADINNKLIKVQCKTCRVDDDGTIEFSTCKTRLNGDGMSRENYGTSIDYFATFYNEKCYLVPLSECGNALKRLRFVSPKSKQIKGINFATDYELEKQMLKME